MSELCLGGALVLARIAKTYLTSGSRRPLFLSNLPCVLGYLIGVWGRTSTWALVTFCWMPRWLSRFPKSLSFRGSRWRFRPQLVFLATLSKQCMTNYSTLVKLS
jgi:hypothetical protein